MRKVFNFFKLVGTIFLFLFAVIALAFTGDLDEM